MENDGSRLLFVVFFQQGGVAMYPLLLCSVLSMAIGIERIITLYKAGRANAQVLPELEGLLGEGKVAEATTRCNVADSPVARVLQAVLASTRGGANSRQKALDRAVARETENLERYLSVLATIGSVSPFIGLFGTVLGIMRAFRDIGLAGSAGGAVVAAGIAEALITTAAGLCVAVVAVVAFNHLMTWAQSVSAHTELDAEELAALLE